MIYISFVDDIFQITSRLLVGNIYRPLSYGEMGELVAPYGYGVLPYGLQGKFDAEGNFIEIMEYY
jgi:hypothetical protein